MAENGIFIKLDPCQMEYLEIHFLEALHKVSKERDEARKWARRMVRERDEIKTKAQEQSEIIQRDWISPAEKMGMEDKIIELTKGRSEQTRRLTLAILALLDIASIHVSEKCPHPLVKATYMVLLAKQTLEELGLDI